MVDRAGYIGLGQYFIKWWIELGTLGRDSTLSNGGYGWVHWVGTVLYQMVDRAGHFGPFLIRIFIVRKISILSERLVQIFNLMVRSRINGIYH